MNNHYDYIITGAGCAGLSLLQRILLEPTLSSKNILVIDEKPKITNDRTWCFWEKENGLFEDIIHHSYNEIAFASNHFSKRILLDNYRYKMIQGIDFYNTVMHHAKGFANVEFKYEKVKKLTTENELAIVETESNTYKANYIFNSILFPDTINTNSKKNYYLLQHFKGWVIETPNAQFNPSIATLMDFTVSQKEGTTFMYTMPTSATTALVEYTLFTKNLLQQSDYENALKEYIEEDLKISNYTIQHEEFGIIPMTNHYFPLQDGRIIYIGIAGGQAKGSSGYAFQFIQKRTKKIIANLISKNHPFCNQSFNDKKFRFFDSVLLQVLHDKKMNGDEIFANIFKKNAIKTVLRFLDNESSLIEDLKIMSSVPMKIFLPAALKQLFK